MEENMAKDIAIHIISLGCAKNLVNTEQMMLRLNNAGYYFVEDPDWADVVIINTCGFIDSAKSEAIEEILGIAEANGVKFAYVYGKGRRLPEIFASSDADCDGILDASSVTPRFRE